MYIRYRTYRIFFFYQIPLVPGNTLLILIVEFVDGVTIAIVQKASACDGFSAQTCLAPWSSRWLFTHMYTLL